MISNRNRLGAHLSILLRAFNQKGRVLEYTTFIKKVKVVNEFDGESYDK